MKYDWLKNQSVTASQVESDESAVIQESYDCWVPEDSVRAVECFGYGKGEDSEEDLDLEDWEDDLDNEDLQEALTQYAAKMDVDIRDEDWVPESLKQRKQRQQQKSKRDHKGKFQYRFREIPKKTFQEAKDAAFQYLDACNSVFHQPFLPLDECISARTLRKGGGMGC